MGNKSPGTRVRKRLVVALLLLLSYNVTAFELEILPEKPVSGRVTTLKIWTEIPAEDKISVKDIDLPVELQRISGPIVRTYRKRVDGTRKRYHQITWAVRGSNPGIYNLPEVTVETEGNEYNLEFPKVIIFRNDETSNNYPLLVNWSQDIKRDIYVGESLPLIVEASNLEEIHFPDRVVSSSPRKGEFIPVSGLGDIYQEDIEGENLYRVSVASWIYTPLEVGKVVIPSVRVDINGLRRFTGKLELNVLPLPDINITRGVGEFIITTSLSETQVTPDDTFSYKIKVEGQGNLPYFNIPDFEHNGLIVLNKNETEHIAYGQKGALGWREIEYTMQAIDSGVKEIKLPAFSWIDWGGNEIFYNGQARHINVVSVKVIEEEILPFLSFMTTPEIISSYRAFLYKKPVIWLTLLISSLLILIFSVRRMLVLSSSRKTLLITMAILPISLFSFVFAKGLEYQGDLVAAENYIEEGDYTNAITIYSQLKEVLPNNYGLYVNMAILWDKLGDLSNAVNAIRIAERIYPSSRKIYQIKNYLYKSEETAGKQARTVSSINPDYIFYVLIILFNILVYVVFKLRKNRSITNISTFFVVALFTLIAGATLLWIDSKNSIDAGIISSEGAELVKVPNEMALDWMKLKPGSCVYIRSEWMDSYLIETEYGLQGWIEKTNIIVLEER